MHPMRMSHHGPARVTFWLGVCRPATEGRSWAAAAGVSGRPMGRAGSLQNILKVCGAVRLSKLA